MDMILLLISNDEKGDIEQPAASVLVKLGACSSDVIRLQGCWSSLERAAAMLSSCKGAG